MGAVAEAENKWWEVAWVFCGWFVLVFCSGVFLLWFLKSKCNLFRLLQYILQIFSTNSL